MIKTCTKNTIKKRTNILILLIVIFCFLSKGEIPDEEIPDEKSLIVCPSPLNDFKLHRFTHGDIIYIFGASTSGKSTLLKEIAERKPEFVTVSTSRFKKLFAFKTLQSLFPDQIKSLRQIIFPQDIVHIIFNDDTFDKRILRGFLEINKEVPENIKIIQSRLDDEILTAYPTQEAYISHFYEFFFSYIFDQSSQGKTVVVDNIEVSRLLTYKLKYFYHSPIFHILNYLPPKLFYQRVLERNRKAIIQGNYSNVRSFMRPAETFLSIYDKKGMVVDSLNRSQMYKILFFLYSAAKTQKLRNRLIDIKFDKIVKIFDEKLVPRT